MSDPDHPSSDIDRNTPAGLMIDVVLFAVGFMMLLPLVFLVSNAFKTPPELLAWPPTIIPNQPTLENILGVLHETPLLRWIGNTLPAIIADSGAGVELLAGKDNCVVLQRRDGCGDYPAIDDARR